MIATNDPMNASNFLTPKCCKPKNTNVDSDVKNTPTTVGNPKINFNANAVPITSGTSDAMIPNSDTTHNALTTFLSYSSR